MLQNIRDLTQGWVTWVIISFICFTFALWGIHNYMGGTGASDAAATVNGVDITQNEFQTAFRALLDQQQSVLGAQVLPNEFLEKQFRNQALEQLIINQVLLQSARKQGFVIGETRLQQVLQSLPVFQVNGHFSPERFASAAVFYHVSPAQLLSQIQNEILINQVQTGIMNSSFVLPTENKAMLKLWSQKRDIKYAIFPIAAIEQKQIVSDEVVKNYYEAHKENFLKPETVKIEYIQLSLDDVMKTGQFANDKHKAELAFSELGEKMANIAYENPDSLTPVSTALKLPVKTSDYFTKEAGSGIAKDKKILKATFTPEVLDQGYNSEAILLDSGDMVVLRVVDRKPVAYQPLEEVKPVIVATLQKKQANEVLQQSSIQIIKEIQEGASLADVAKKNKFVWQEKNDLSRQADNIDKTILEKTFALEIPADIQHPTVTGGPLRNGDYAVVVVMKVNDDKIDPIDELKNKMFDVQLANEVGKLDYELYVRSLVSHAKIQKYE